MKQRTWKTFEEFKQLVDQSIEKAKERDRTLKPATMKGLESVPRPPFVVSDE